jgi:hypothetical protein
MFPLAVADPPIQVYVLAHVLFVYKKYVKMGTVPISSELFVFAGENEQSWTAERFRIIMLVRTNFCCI